MGELNLTTREFRNLLYKEYFWKVRGYWMRQEREWERTRLIVAALTGKSPIEIIRLSCDPDPIDWDDSESQDYLNNAKHLWN
jgi:hypothetical protein